MQSRIQMNDMVARIRSSSFETQGSRTCNMMVVARISIIHNCTTGGQSAQMLKVSILGMNLTAFLLKSSNSLSHQDFLILNSAEPLAPICKLSRSSSHISSGVVHTVGASGCPMPDLEIAGIFSSRLELSQRSYIVIEVTLSDAPNPKNVLCPD